MELITTLATVPAVVALVTLIKNLGLRSTYLPLLAVVFGVALSLFDFFALPGSTGTWPQAAGTGLILGLTASGLYDTAKAVGTRKTTNADSVVYESPDTRPEQH